MANSLRDVKMRINSTKSTAQITKAMYMVSQSKVRHAEETYKEYTDFMSRISNMVASILSVTNEYYVHPLIHEREVKKTAYLIISSDRGLAGAYNNNLFKYLEQQIKENHESRDEYICAAIGKKGFGYLKQKNYDLIKNEPTYVRDDVMFIDILPLADSIIKSYLNGTIDKLVIIYNHYVNSLTQEIVSKTLLPIYDIKGETTDVEYIYESGIENTLDLLLPMYIQDLIYGIILDAKTSEHSARMNSMKTATDNAEEVIDKLQLIYNRARQELITNELIDIVGGANAIGGKE